MRHSLTLLLLAGCGVQPSEAGVTLTQHTAKELAGRFVRGDVTVEFSAVESGQVVTQEYRLGELVFRATSDHAAGLGRIDSNHVVLTAAQKSALEEMTHQLEDQLPADRVLVEDVVYRGSAYLASAMANEIIPS